ncbi:hypothetical protein CPC08DRAFT_762997 [Agrocybe pediades]|nr:hypothetical protein CPC08DRAFT_762997 [Agrocybe pediades]
MNMVFLSVGKGWEQFSTTILTSPSGIPYATPPIIWGADGLLVWRCIILYQGIPRAGEWALKAALGILSLTSLGLGIMTFWPFNNFVAFSATFVNIILSGLLSTRIIYIQRRLSNLLGSELSHQSPYTKIVMMCIESSALIVAIGVACIISVYASESAQWFTFPFFLLPHICVISQMLIINRVAQGRTIELLTSDHDGGRRVSTMIFGNDTRTDC